MFEVHSFAGCKQVCGISGCPRSFSSYSAFTSHANRKHVNWRQTLLDAAPRDITSSFDSDQSTDGAGADNMDVDIEQELDVDATLSPAENQGTTIAVYSNETIQRRAALFLLTLKERYKCTQAAIDFTSSGMSSLIENLSGI